jgi:hypothetical protein
MMIAGDVSWDNWEGRLAFLIDDDVQTVIHSNNNTVPGASLTLDLGKKAKLSRIKLYARQHTDAAIYGGGSFRIFEVYSSDEEGDSPDGDWSAWTLRKVCTVIKISGASYDSWTSDDIVAGKAGFDFSLPVDMPKVRYLRFKVLNVWGDTYSHAAELNVYGDYNE